MFRGAIILGIGFSMGYVKALHESEEIKELLKHLLYEIGKREEKRAAEKPPEKVDESDEVIITDAVEATIIPEPPTTTEGE